MIGSLSNSSVWPKSCVGGLRDLRKRPRMTSPGPRGLLSCTTSNKARRFRPGRQDQGGCLPAAAHWLPPRKSYYDGRPKCCPDALWPSQAKTAAVVAATGCPRSFFVSDNDQLPPIRVAQHYAAIVSGARGRPQPTTNATESHEHARQPPERIGTPNAFVPRSAPRTRPSPSPHRTSRRSQTSNERRRRKIPLSEMARTRVRAGPRAGS